MAILANCPSLSYIYIKDCIITYNNTPYQILNTYTMKPYVYWDSNNPYELITSNTILKEKTGLFYICFNDKGNPIIVPQTDITISFGENTSRDLVTEKILGFKEQNEINEEKFTTIQVDINGIKTTVGTVQDDIEGAMQTISEVNQKADNISASVSTLEREYNENQELNTLRDDVNIALLNLQSTLGAFSSDMNNFMEDNELSDEESNQINVYKNEMTTELNNLNEQISKVITLLKSQEKSEEATRLTTQKGLLNSSINNLLNNIDIASADGIFTNTEMTTIVSYFANANTKINETNNMIDEFIFLETGGALVKQLSELNISQNEIKLSVSKNEENIQHIEVKVNVSVKNVDVMYYLSTSATSLNGGSWSTDAPQWVNGKYIWSKTVTTYTNGSTTETDPVCITGAKGEDGVPGKDGINGTTTYTWIRYANDSIGTDISNDPTDKTYIGIATNKTTATESNNPSDYTWSEIKGKDGIPGTNGKDGITYYTWIKYSDNADGTELYDIPNNNTKYIGIATNKTAATESTNKTDYTWSLFKGTDGTGIQSITEEYYLSTSKTTQTGGSWVTTPPTWEYGKYLWTRSKIVYKNPTSTKYTTPICNSSWDAIHDVEAEVETVKETIAEHTVNLENITSRVSTTENNITTINGKVSNLTSRVSTAEQKITDDAIKSVVSQSFYTKTETDSQIQTANSSLTQTVNGFEARVTKNEKDISSLILTNEEFEVTIGNKADKSNIISTINASTEKITINSSKINISGFVTFSDLSTSGSTTINGANITTGYISCDRLKGGTISAANEINFIGGARIFGNEGGLGSGLKISAAGITLSGGSVNHLSGNWYIIDGGKLTIDSGNLIVSKGNITANIITANSGFFGSGNTALNNSYIYTPYGSDYRDYLRLGGHLITSDSGGTGYLLVLTTGGSYASLRANAGSFANDVGCVDVYASNKVYAGGVALTSDKSLKTDIRYIGIDSQGISDNGFMAPNVNITTQDMHNFIETLPMVSYRMKQDVLEDVDYTYYGFIAQDILYTKVGSELIENGTITETETILDENGEVSEVITNTRDILRYSENKFIAFICGALQEEIKQRKALERQLNDLINTINK